MRVTKYNKVRTIIVPEILVTEINTILNRHGYGPDNLSIQIKDQKADKIYYTCTIVCDDVMSGIIDRILAKIKTDAIKENITDSIYNLDKTFVESVEHIKTTQKKEDFIRVVNVSDPKSIQDTKP